MVYNLKSFKIGSIADNNKAKGLGTADTADPAADFNLLIQKLLSGTVNLNYSD